MPHAPNGPQGMRPPTNGPQGMRPPTPNMPMPPGAGQLGPPAGAPPPWLMAQLMAQQGQQQQPMGMEGLVQGLQQMLDQWTERDPNTVAGSYFQDVVKLLASFA